MNANKLTRFSLALITGCAIIAALVGFKTMPPFVVESLIDDPLLPDSVESLRHYLTNNAEDIDARQKFALLLYRGGHHSEAIQEYPSLSLMRHVAFTLSNLARLKNVPR